MICGIKCGIKWHYFHVLIVNFDLRKLLLRFQIIIKKKILGKWTDLFCKLPQTSVNFLFLINGINFLLYHYYERLWCLLHSKSRQFNTRNVLHCYFYLRVWGGLKFPGDCI